MRSLCWLMAAVVLAVVSPVEAAAPPWIPRDAYGDELPPGAVARYGTSRLFMAGELLHQVFSPDNKRLLTLSDRQADLWDVATGRLLAELPNKGWFKTAAFGPNGLVYLFGDEDAGFKWDTQSGKRRSFDLPGGGLLFSSGRGSVSKDGKRLVVPVENRLLLVDLPGGRVRERYLFRDGRDLVEVALSPDGKRVAIVCQEKQLHLCDPVGGDLIWSLPAPADEKSWSCCRFSPDGRTLACLRAGKPYVVETSSGRAPRGFVSPADLHHAVGFTPDGKQLVGLADDHRIRHFDSRTGKAISAVNAAVRKGEVHTAILSANARVASLVDSSSIVLLDTRTGKPLHPALAARRPLLRAWSLTNKQIACSTSNRRIEVWDPATGRATRRPATIAGVETGSEILDLHPGGDKVLIRESGLRVVSLSTGKDLWKDRDVQDDPPSHASFSPDGTRFAGMESGRVVIRETATGRRLRSISEMTSGAPTWSRDGRMLALYVADRGWVVVAETATGRARFRRRFVAPEGVDGAISPDGQRLAVVTEDSLLVWQLRPPREVFEQPLPPPRAGDGAWGNPGSWVRFSSDGTCLAVMGHREVRVWDSQGRPRGILRGHRARLNDFCFSSDGRTLVTASEDGTALVWDIHALRNPKAARLDDMPLDRAWRDLASPDAEKAFASMAILERNAANAVALARRHLALVVAPDPKTLDQLLTDLDSESPAVRRRAFAALQSLDQSAEKALRHLLKTTKSTEARRAARQLLVQIDGPVTDPDRLREVRAVELLERIGSPQARALLAALAKGADSRLTREARESSERLAQARR